MKILILIPLILLSVIILAQDLENKEEVDSEKDKVQTLAQKQQAITEVANAEVETEKEQDLSEEEEYDQKNLILDPNQPRKPHPKPQNLEVPIVDPYINDEYIGPIDADPVDPIFLCDYSDPTYCLRDRNCIWDKTLNCVNKLNCSQIPIEKCDLNKPCHLTPSSVGYCSGPTEHCKSYSLKQCSKDPQCFWLTTQKCFPKDPQPPIPNCGGMNPIQCFKNSQFCNLQGKCFDNKNYCSSLNYSQCIFDPACNYTFTQKEQCLDNPKFCSNLSEKACLKNSLFCNGVYTIPQCVNQFNCDGLNYDQCKQNFKYCQNISTPFTCKPRRRNNCNKIRGIDKCKIKRGCQVAFVNDQFICQNTPCDQFDEEKCRANQNHCIYTPESFTCKNYGDCENITDPTHCKLTKGCYLISSQFKCLPKKQQCKLLSGIDCKKNPSCTYIPAKGDCSQDMDFGCANLSLLQCEKNKHCTFKYSCTPKPIPTCNLLNQIDCKKSEFCNLVEKGQCYDKKFDCGLPYDKCILTKPCQWHPGIQGKCVNNLECNHLPIEECMNNDEYCNHNSIGYCRPR